ncbi:MAG: glycosyltransferase family 4 protein [Dehalococcoidia bacterium]
MRICLLSYRGNPYCGGQGIYIYYLSRALLELGHEVDVMAGPPYPELAEGIQLHRLESLELYEPDRSALKILSRLHDPINLYEVLSVGTGTFAEPLTFSLRAYRKIKALMAERRFDIIHDNQCLGYGLLLLKRLDIPVVATIHHPIPIDRDMAIAQARYPWRKLLIQRWYAFCGMQGRVARRLERIITVSNSSARSIEQAHRVSRHQMRVVHNGIDTELFRRVNGVPKRPNSLVLVNSGEQSLKGVPYLLKALRMLRDGTDIRLTIVGSPVPEGQYLRLIKQYGIEDMVTFTGRVSVDRLVREYATAEMCVVPSLYEGFGLPAAEAMACGLPVVSTTGGALPEVVGRDGEAGLLVPPAQPEALAAAIRRLLSNASLREKMGEAGRKRIESEFTWRRAAQRTVEVYREVT